MAKKKNVSNQKATGKKIPAKRDWPVKRNVFFRPDRLKYVKKLIKPDGCVFCHSAQAEISFESLCVYKSKYSQIVLNKFPYNTGHLLILPLAHGGDLLALSKAEFADLSDCLRLAVEAIQSVYSPAGFNIGMNHGSSAGAGIPDHIHYHIVPRWGGDLNFFPLIADTKLVIETLETSYAKLFKYFQKRKAN